MILSKHVPIGFSSSSSIFARSITIIFPLQLKFLFFQVSIPTNRIHLLNTNYFLLQHFLIEYIFLHLFQMKYKIDEAMKGSINYNVTECATIAEDFDRTGDRVSEEVWQCVYNVTEKVEKHKQVITKRLNNVMKDLVDILLEAQVCSGESNAQALDCVNKVSYLSPK